MASRFILPLADVGNGISPSDGAKLNFFATGTSTLKDTFSDEAATTKNPNPVIANQDGVFPEIWITGEYKVTLKDKNNKPAGFVEQDPVIEAANVSQSAKTIATVADMVADKGLFLGQVLDIEDYATGNNSGTLFFKVVSSGTGTADAGAYIDLPNTTPALQAQQNFPAIRTVKMWGAPGSGATDVTDAFTNGSIHSRLLHVPEGRYVVDGAVLSNDTHLWGVGDSSIIEFAAGGSAQGIFVQGDIENIEVDHLSLITPDLSGDYGLLCTLPGNVQKENINIHDCFFEDFAIHGVATNGFSPISADDGNAGYVNVRVNYCRFNRIGSSAFLPNSNCENIEFIGNRSTNSLGGITMKADTFSRNVVIANNVVDGNLGAEGGCDKIFIHGNFTTGTIFLGSGTVTTAAGGQGEPLFACQNSYIHDNDCTRIEVVGHEAHDANVGAPYDWVARPYEAARNIHIHSNTVRNSAAESYQLTRLGECKIYDNKAIDGVTAGFRLFKIEGSEVYSNTVTDCGGTGNSSYLLDGDAVQQTSDTEFRDNTALNRTDVKTVGEIVMTEFVDNIISSHWTIDAGTSSISLVGINYGDATNVTVRHPTEFINSPVTKFSLGSATFKDGANQITSAAFDLSSGSNHVLMNPTNGRLAITDIDFVYESAGTGGTASTLRVGEPANAGRNTATASDIAASQWDVQSLPLSSFTNKPDEIVTVSNVAGTDGATGRFIVTYSPL